MLIVAFLCFLSLIVGWLFAPTSDPRPNVETMGTVVPEQGTSLA